MARKTDIQPHDETVKCCHDACHLSAKVKLKTSTGWANVCMRHYDEHFDDNARKYCASIGLRTTAERLAWLKQQAKRLTKRYTTNSPREPGSDYEEDVA